MKLLFNLLFLLSFFYCSAQPITGVWRGKITNGSGIFASNGKVELKLIKKGDSLVGTCYYYNNANTYMRYSVKGYFDSIENSVHWTDDKFLGVKPVGKTTVGVFNDPMVSEADFNCPGNNVMKLDGKSQIGKEGPTFTLHFDKVEKPIFRDEWDNVIEGYFTGMADPNIIDSVYAIAKPYEPSIPTDVARQVNPVIPGKNTQPADPKSKSTGSTTGTVVGGTAGVNTTSSASIASPGDLPASTATATAPAITTKQTTKGQPVSISKADSSKPSLASAQTPTDEGRKTTTPDNPGVAAATTGQPVKTDVKTEQPVSAPGKPITGSTPSTTAATISTPSSGTGKTAGSTVAVTNPSSATQKPPAAGPNTNVSQPSTGAKTGTPANTTAAVKPKENAPASTTAVEKTVAGNPALPPVVASSAGKAAIPAVATASSAIIKSDPLAEKMYITRKKINQAEIPVVGDSIELNFYDNAEIDGDSISLFLNGKLLFNHVLLSAQAYTFKIAASELPEGSELTMVAENLGTIPPNTAFMMAIVNGERYTARIESTEQTSGVIKLVRRR